MNKKLTTCIASLFIGLSALSQADEFTLVDGNLNGFVHIREHNEEGKPDDLYISRNQIRTVRAVELEQKTDKASAEVKITVGDTGTLVHIYYFSDYAKAKAFAERVVEGS
ncbi:hypothetical protein JIN77_10420 [Verrucomicrobiaceae bacterium R5-34]|uniref:Uncharacterized protein n=1 Tax=Oceaniferula flava TaxID=2800421 RepID=A0AAE2V9S7_9BACT|nr:hypothetical protein [Oceaniferula flavus]MBK1831142.1 hypothetical protein [Verrucomicrobiaceae bacterium R5-34]MBK1855658.1 hypothetical protein [Oceaniferula flavus]MBM1136964.1 hypothetical protein [Oceaniferula flavus]